MSHAPRARSHRRGRADDRPRPVARRRAAGAARDARPAEAYQPRGKTHGAWSVDSLIEDAGLQGRFLLTLDFDAAGVAWLASADGLYSYDGYTWRRFTTADGLPSDFVRCATVARDGRIWIGTDRGCVLYDGRSFEPLPGGDRLAGQNIRRIVEDVDGTMWFCSDTWLHAGSPSGLTAYRDGVCEVFREADGLPSDYVSDYFRDSRGRQFVLTREGLAQWDGERWTQPLAELGLEDADEYMWSIVETPRDGVLVGTTTAFFRLRRAAGRGSRTRCASAIRSCIRRRRTRS